MKLVISIALAILGNMIGLIVASLIVPDFIINPLGFIASGLMFTFAQIILAPFILKLALTYAPAIRGGIALVTIFFVLLLTTMFTDGIAIRSAAAWAIAPLVIWIATIIAGIILPLIIFKNVMRASETRGANDLEEL